MVSQCVDQTEPRTRRQVESVIWKLRLGACADILTNCWTAFGRVLSFWNPLTPVEVHWGGLSAAPVSLHSGHAALQQLRTVAFDTRPSVGSGHRAGSGRMPVADAKVLED